jgi:hypothetical protein
VASQTKRPQTRNRSSDCPNWGHMGVAHGLLIEFAGISAPDHDVPTPPCDYIPQGGVCVLAGQPDLSDSGLF